MKYQAKIRIDQLKNFLDLFIAVSLQGALRFRSSLLGIVIILKSF